MGNEGKDFQREETGSAKALRWELALCIQSSTNRPVLFVDWAGESRRATGGVVRYVRPYRAK